MNSQRRPDQAQATEILDRGYSAADSEIGQFNLALFGMTGVGKSTLVNAVFGVPIAETGVGRPVTQGAHLHQVPGQRMGIVDTEGLEIGESSDTVSRRLRELIETSQAGDLSGQIHVIWYCVRATDRRFTDAEADFVTQLASLGPPVLLVMTRTPVGEKEWPPDVAEMYRHLHSLALPVLNDEVFLVNAVADDWSGTPAHGLEALLAATEQAAPIGVKRALIAAQRIDGAGKLKQGREVVAASAESLELQPMLRQVRSKWAEMIASISIAYGLPKDVCVTAALQSRELTSLHRLIYTSQAGVLAAPLRYAYLAGAKATRLAADSETGERARAWARERRERRKGAPPAPAPPPPPEVATMGSGLSASTVTRAIGDSWIVVCDRAYRASYPEAPAIAPEAFAEQFNAELDARMSKPLRLWRNVATKAADDKAADEERGKP